MAKQEYSRNALLNQQMSRLDNDKNAVKRKKRQFYLTGGAAALGAAALAGGGGAKVIRGMKHVQPALKHGSKPARFAGRLPSSAKVSRASSKTGKVAGVLGVGSGANWAASLPSEVKAEQKRISAKEKRLKRL